MNNEKRSAPTARESAYGPKNLILLAGQRANYGRIRNLPSHFKECNLYETDPKDLFEESAEKGIALVFTKSDFIWKQKEQPLKGIWATVSGPSCKESVLDESGDPIGYTRKWEYSPYPSPIITQKYLYRMIEHVPMPLWTAKFPEYVLCKIGKLVNPKWRKENDDTTLGASNSDSQGLKSSLPSTDTQPESTSKSLEQQQLNPTDIPESKRMKTEEKKE